MRLDEQIIAVAIADVIGKGVPAAMMMSMFRGALRAYSDGGYGRHSMIEIITKLNTMACRECRDGEFITLFLAIVNVRDRLITYCNCGHEPGLLLRGGDVLELNKGGLVLGIMDDAEYATETVPLALGDCLLMYTDGLIDAMNFDNERWGKERMVAAAMQCAGCPADEMVRTIIGLRRRFVGLWRRSTIRASWRSSWTAPRMTRTASARSANARPGELCRQCGRISGIFFCGPAHRMLITSCCLYAHPCRLIA